MQIIKRKLPFAVLTKDEGRVFHTYDISVSGKVIISGVSKRMAGVLIEQIKESESKGR